MKAVHPLLVAALCLGTSGCWFGKTAPKVPAPPVAPQPVAAQPAPPAAPVLEPPPPSPPPVVQNAEPAPVPKETPLPKPVVRRNPVPEPLPSVAPPAPVAPPPQLQEIISDDRRRQYELELSQGITRAGAALKQASTRALNASQQETVARIRTFLAQANAARDNDISTALQLARRADLLGQELLKSLK